MRFGTVWSSAVLGGSRGTWWRAGPQEGSSAGALLAGTQSPPKPSRSLRWLGTPLPWGDLPVLPFPIGTSAGSGATGDAKGHSLDWKL